MLRKKNPSINNSSSLTFQRQSCSKLQLLWLATKISKDASQGRATSLQKLLGEVVQEAHGVALSPCCSSSQQTVNLCPVAPHGDWKCSDSHSCHLEAPFLWKTKQLHTHTDQKPNAMQRRKAAASSAGAGHGHSCLQEKMTEDLKWQNQGAQNKGLTSFLSFPQNISLCSKLRGTNLAVLVIICETSSHGCVSHFQVFTVIIPH